jgi:hypothetical protein
MIFGALRSCRAGSVRRDRHDVNDSILTFASGSSGGGPKRNRSLNSGRRCRGVSSALFRFATFSTSKIRPPNGRGLGRNSFRRSRSPVKPSFCRYGCHCHWESRIWLRTLAAIDFVAFAKACGAYRCSRGRHQRRARVAGHSACRGYRRSQ